jgi:hypothetical protein
MLRISDQRTGKPCFGVAINGVWRFFNNHCGIFFAVPDSEVDIHLKQMGIQCDHEYVNMGFVTRKMICKKCNQIQPEA